MPAVLTKQALALLEGSDDRRVHIVRPGTMRPVGRGLFSAVTLCGETIIGNPVHGDAPRATCVCCIAASPL